MWRPRVSDWIEELMSRDDLDSRSASRVRRQLGGRALFFDGDTHRGMQMLTEAKDLDPRSSLAHAFAALAGMMLGRSDFVHTEVRLAMETAVEPVERLFAFHCLGKHEVDSGRMTEATVVAADFLEWARAMRFPTAIAMAHLLRGRALSETDPHAAVEEFDAGHHVNELLDNWVVRVSLLREQGALAPTGDPASALTAYADAIGLCYRHNDTGNVMQSLCYAAILLFEHDLEVAAARMVEVNGRLRAEPI